MKRIIIAGGGTGGHFYPAFSIAKELKKRNWQIVFAVKKDDICIPILKENDITYVEIDMIAFSRGINIFRHLLFIFKLLNSLFYSLRIIKDFQPNAIFGTGSYVAFPLIFAGWIKGKKTIIHESNAVIGMSNYISGFFSDKILLGTNLRNSPFPSKTKVTGTPIREIFYYMPEREKSRKELNLPVDETVFLIFGGSQGSQNINEAFYKLLIDFAVEKRKINFIQITGRKNYKEIIEKYQKANLLNENAKIFDYYENMPLLYSACDIVISRSGSSTITELIYTKKPAILIPLKSAAADHQTENAQVLSRHGCCILLKDDENLTENLKKTIIQLLNPSNISAMIKAYQRIDLPSGKKVIENIIEEIEK